jgi:hypothetical protein
MMTTYKQQEQELHSYKQQEQEQEGSPNKLHSRDLRYSRIFTRAKIFCADFKPHDYRFSACVHTPEALSSWKKMAGRRPQFALAHELAFCRNLRYNIYRK